MEHVCTPLHNCAGALGPRVTVDLRHSETGQGKARLINATCCFEFYYCSYLLRLQFNYFNPIKMYIHIIINLHTLIIYAYMCIYMYICFAYIYIYSIYITRKRKLRDNEVNLFCAVMG